MLKLWVSKKTWPAWLIFAIGLLATVFVSLQVKHEIEINAVKQFSFISDQIALKIQERLGAYSLALRGGAALFAASDTVERQEWKAYVGTLRAQNNVIGMHGLGFNQLIPADQLSKHIASMHREGFSDYTVRPSGIAPFSSHSLH